MLGQNVLTGATIYKLPLPVPPRLKVLALLTAAVAPLGTRALCWAFRCGWNLVLSFCLAEAAAERRAR